MITIQTTLETGKGVRLVQPCLVTLNHVKLTELYILKNLMEESAAGCELNVSLYLSQSFEYLNEAIRIQERLAK